MLHINTDPIEPSFDMFLDVIRSMLESPDTAEKTRDVAIYVLLCATVNRLLIIIIVVVIICSK